MNSSFPGPIINKIISASARIISGVTGGETSAQTAESVRVGGVAGTPIPTGHFGSRLRPITAEELDTFADDIDINKIFGLVVWHLGRWVGMRPALTAPVIKENAICGDKYSAEDEKILSENGVKMRWLGHKIADTGFGAAAAIYHSQHEGVRIRLKNKISPPAGSVRSREEIQTELLVVRNQCRAEISECSEIVHGHQIRRFRRWRDNARSAVKALLKAELHEAEHLQLPFVASQKLRALVYYAAWAWQDPVRDFPGADIFPCENYFGVQILSLPPDERAIAEQRKSEQERASEKKTRESNAIAKANDRKVSPDQHRKEVDALNRQHDAIVSGSPYLQAQKRIADGEWAHHQKDAVLSTKVQTLSQSEVDARAAGQPAQPLTSQP